MRRRELETAAHHFRAELRETSFAQHSLGVGQQRGFLVGHVAHHVAHQLKQRRVERLVLRARLPELRDQAPHFVVLGNALVDEIGRERAHRRIEDFLLEPRVDLQREAKRIGHRLLLLRPGVDTVAVESRECVRVIHANKRGGSGEYPTHHVVHAVLRF